MSDQITPETKPRTVHWTIIAAAAVGLAVWANCAWTQAGRPGAASSGDSRFASAKFYKTENERTYLWASGPKRGPDSEWFDITDSPLDKGKFQYGLGKDTIPSIDAPVAVAPDDQRLTRFLKDPRGKIDDIRIIGYAAGGQARAYPIGLLDRHELVNDTIGGKPVTVGW